LCKAEVAPGEFTTLKLLVDTGAEVSIIREGIVPEEHLYTLHKPWKLTAANQQLIRGGEQVAKVILHLEGFEVDTGKPQGLKVPTHFLVADLGRLDAIVSYGWLAANNLLVNGRRHGMCRLGTYGEGMIWFGGMKAENARITVTIQDGQAQQPKHGKKKKGKKAKSDLYYDEDMKGIHEGDNEKTEDAKADKQNRGIKKESGTPKNSGTYGQIPPVGEGCTDLGTRHDMTEATSTPSKSHSSTDGTITNGKIRRLLDLFSGYGSVAEIFRERGYEVVTLDIDPIFNTDIQTDVLAWRFWEAYPRFILMSLHAAPLARNIARP